MQFEKSCDWSPYFHPEDATILLYRYLAFVEINIDDYWNDRKDHWNLYGSRKWHVLRIPAGFSTLQKSMTTKDFPGENYLASTHDEEGAKFRTNIHN